MGEKLNAVYEANNREWMLYGAGRNIEFESEKEKKIEIDGRDVIIKFRLQLFRSSIKRMFFRMRETFYAQKFALLEVLAKFECKVLTRVYMMVGY